MEDKKNKSLQEIKKELQGQVLTDSSPLYLRGGKAVEVDRPKSAMSGIVPQ